MATEVLEKKEVAREYKTTNRINQLWEKACAGGDISSYVRDLNRGRAETSEVEFRRHFLYRYATTQGAIKGILQNERVVK